MQEKNLLAADHDEVDELLGAAFDALGSGSGGDAFARTDLFWARLAMHIRAEHLHLFPAVLTAAGNASEAESARLNGIIEGLQDDHNFFMRQLVDAIKLLRAAGPEMGEDVRNEAAAILRSVAARLEAHNRIEEQEIYPLMDKMFGEAGSKELNASIRHEITNLPPRFSDGGDAQ